MSESLPRDYVDRVIRGLWQRAPAELLRLALGDPTIAVEALLDPAPAVLKRAADGAARAIDASGPFVGHVEFETAGRAEVLWRAAMYGLILNHTEGLPVRSAVVLLEPSASLDSAFEMRHGADLLCLYRVRLVRLYEVEASALATRLDLAPLTPFGAHADVQALEAAARTIRAEAGPGDRGDLLAALYILGGRRFTLSRVLKILSKEELMESVTLRHIVEESMREGREEGREEGRQEGRQESRARLVAMLLRQISLRFPGEAPRLQPLLRDATLDDLDAISEAILTSSDAEQLFAFALARVRPS